MKKLADSDIMDAYQLGRADCAGGQVASSDTWAYVWSNVMGSEPHEAYEPLSRSNLYDAYDTGVVIQNKRFARRLS